MKLLIGNTGLIGTTLKDSMTFDYEFNSSNIHELKDLQLTNSTDVYLSCLPATKWQVNQDPHADLDNILKIIETLSTHSYRNIILYSTIDVYNNSTTYSNEDTSPSISKLDYGSNRYLFELLVKSNIKHNKLIILRLPALFGKHIKKNVIYDLLNNNEVHKIQLNSKYQWYNLNHLSIDTDRYINSPDSYLCVNLFSEPIDTSHIVKLFSSKKVDTKTPGAIYDYQTKYSTSGYYRPANDILNEIREFITEYEFLKKNIKIAICLFGEQRNLLDHIPYWKHLQTKFHSVDFFTAMYVNETMQDTLRILDSSLNLKEYHIAFNDLDKFNKSKKFVKNPIYIYKTDVKATIPRLMSQLYIRQKTAELVDINKYDVMLLCRTDFANLNLSFNDIIDVYNDKNLIKIGYEKHHIHPGGGGGCTQCTTTKKCDNEYHANDICDLWSIGSTNAMAPWKYIYDTAYTNYAKIQKTSKDIYDEQYQQNIIEEFLEENEIHITFTYDNIKFIENDIHCFYPEKLMRIAFKDVKLCNSNQSIEHETSNK